MNIVASTRLFFTEGRSDKEYHAEIAAVPGGYVVNFRYGRRSGTLTCGSKTPVPVAREQAEHLYQQLVQQKTSKGYTLALSGSPYQDSAVAGRKTDFLPQLLNAISDAEARSLIEDDRWLAQPKMDGERRAVHADENGFYGINRKGLVVPLPLPVLDALNALACQHGPLRLDGEQIGDTLHVFDLLIHRGESLQPVPWFRRMALAQTLLKDCRAIQAVPVAHNPAEKRALWYGIQTDKGEGIVFKRASSPVTPGRPNSGGDWRKFKFTASASCLVTAINPDKRSLRIGLLENGGAGQALVPVGNVTLPPNWRIPAVGDIVEVTYLYAYPGGSLFQPVYGGERNDLAREDCTLDQLKFKPESVGAG